MKKHFIIYDDSGASQSRKLAYFQKTFSYIQDDPFFQVVEYIVDETVCKPRPHSNAKDKVGGEYQRTAPSVMEQINEQLEFGNSVSSTYTSLIRECRKANVQGVINPRNREQVRNVQKHIIARQ